MKRRYKIYFRNTKYTELKLNNRLKVIYEE